VTSITTACDPGFMHCAVSEVGMLAALAMYWSVTDNGCWVRCLCACSYNVLARVASPEAVIIGCVVH
jgi:hypothetical protein